MISIVVEMIPKEGVYKVHATFPGSCDEAPVLLTEESGLASAPRAAGNH